MIDYAYIDLDSVAYVGACIAQKSNYQFTHKDGEKSKKFKSAADAKYWLEAESDLGFIDPSEWTRETIVVEQDESVAIKATEYELNNWIKSIKDLTKNNSIILKGFLTSSGIKTKDIEGLEDRYQFNRYKDRETWTPMDKPKHLKACREYLLRTKDWVKMSPKGIEADAVVVYFAEKKGQRAVIASKDKDLKQAMGTFFIDMNKDKKFRELELIDPLGYLEIIEKPRTKELKGGGFKLLCAQTVTGDASDGYKGLNKFGLMAAYNLLNDCKSIEECCKALVDLYEERFPEGHEYTSWDGKPQQRTAKELLEQHMQLAYHERGAKDTSNPIARYMLKENPIFEYKK